MSIRPGHTTRPPGTSTTLTPSSTGSPRPTRAMRSPSISTSNVPSRALAGSTTCAPFSSHFDIYTSDAVTAVTEAAVSLPTVRSPTTSLIDIDSAGEQVEDGHANGDAVCDLLENH